MRDTTADAEAVQTQLLRQMSAARKLELVASAGEAARILALAGLRARHPEASEAERWRLLHEIELGTDLAQRAFGGLPPTARR